MPATGLSDYGLIAEGQNAYAREQQNLSDLKQQAQLRGQQVETGAIGLEELQRERDTRASVRKAGVDATTAGKTMGGSFMDMADAARKSGDPELAAKYLDAYRQMDAMGARDFIHAIMTNDAPGNRPDLVDLMKRNDMTKDVTSVQVGDHGNYTVTRANGQSSTQNAGRMAQLMGMIGKPEKLGPNEKLVMPTGTEVASNPVDQYKVVGNIIWNSKTGAWHQVDTKGEWKLGTIIHGNQEVPVAINSMTGEVNKLGPGGVRTGLEAKVSQPTVPGAPTLITLPGGEVGEFHPATEATPGRTHWFSHNEPGTPGQPATITPAQMNTPPMPGAQQGIDGNWYVLQGNRWERVLSGGTAASAAQPAATPSGKPGVETPPKPAASKDMRPAQIPATAPTGYRENAPVQQPSPGMRPVELPETIEGATRAPGVGAGLDTLNTVKRALFGAGGQPIDKILKRGEQYEKDDQLLRRTGAEIRRLLATQGTTRNPSILRGAIEDYQTRLERLEKFRGR